MTVNVSAWHNGSPNVATGAGYGLRFLKEFDINHFIFFTTVQLFLSGQPVPLTVKLSNSLVSGRCKELRSKVIGLWLIANSNPTWAKGCPPRFTISQRGNSNIFDVS
jgi:hypothetical protein